MNTDIRQAKEEQVKRVREEIASKFRLAKGRLCFNKEEYRFADEVLSSSRIGIIDDDQSLPENIAWHKDERTFEAYCAGKNELIGANFQKLIKEKE